MQNPPIGYSGQYLDNHAFRIKIRTGGDINNVTGDSVLGELFLVTGLNASENQVTGKLFCATATTDTDVAGSKSHTYHVADLTKRWVNFPNNYSVKFDGLDDYLSIPQGAFDLGSGNWTFSLWFRPTGITTGTPQTLFMVKGDGEYLAAFIESGKLTLTDWGNTNLIYNTTISNNTWYHVLFVKNGSGATDIHLYLQGSKVLEGNFPYAPDFGNDTGDARVGEVVAGLSPPSSYPFQGQIDEFGFWRRALTPPEISNVYMSQLPIQLNGGIPADISLLYPVGWWRFGDGAGDTNSSGASPANGDTVGTIVDQGSGGNDATQTTTSLQPTFSTIVPAFNTYSVAFDGTNDYVSTALDIGGSSALTVSAWVKHDDLTDDSPNLLNQYAGVGAARAMRFSMYAKLDSWAGLLCSLYTSDGIKEANYLLNPIISTGTWYHAAFVFDGTSVKVYYNGDNSQSSATTTWSTAATLNNAGVQVLIGGGSGVGKYIDGNIDEVGIWTSALSASDIAAIYNCGVPTDISSYSPVGWWRMGDNDGGTGTTITDQGSGGNDGTLTNGPIFSTDVP